MYYTNRSDSLSLEDDEDNTEENRSSPAEEGSPSNHKLPDLSSNEPPVMTVIAPTLPNKSIIVLHISDENLETIKKAFETLISLSKKPVVDSPSVPNELDTMFAELYSEGKEVPKPNPSPPPQEAVTPTGSYRTIKQLGDMYPQRPTPEGFLSKADEMVILSSFRSIIGMSYTDAQARVAEQNFILHPLYVSMGSKMPLSKYSNTTIGVRISDPNFDAISMKPSPSARVTELIDVGGVDGRDVGIIKL